MDGNKSLASVLDVGNASFDRTNGDPDILTKAAEAVLEAKPDSPVSLLADGDTALTVFAPTDKAFKNLASALAGHNISSESDAFDAIAGLGIDAVETVLLYHVIQGAPSRRPMHWLRMVQCWPLRMKARTRRCSSPMLLPFGSATTRRSSRTPR